MISHKINYGSAKLSKYTKKIKNMFHTFVKQYLNFNRR